MVKTSTGLSIESELLDKFREKYGAKSSFSDYIEKLVAKDLGQIVSVKELEDKISERLEDIQYLSDKRDELLKIQLQDTLYKSEIEKKDLEQKIQQKEYELQSWIEKTKDIPEITELIEEVKLNRERVADSKFMLEKVDMLRTKYPALRIGVVQLRNILIKLV